MLVSAKEMLKAAKRGHYAAGHFNINNPEWAKSILQSAEEMKSPVILGVFEGAGKYMCGYKTIVGMVEGMIEGLGITGPVAIHLDHGSYEHAYKCIEAGASFYFFASDLSLLRFIPSGCAAIFYKKRRTVTVQNLCFVMFSGDSPKIRHIFTAVRQEVFPFSNNGRRIGI